MYKYEYFYKPKNKHISDETIAYIVDYLFGEVQHMKNRRYFEVKILNIYDLKISNFRKAVKYCELAQDISSPFIRFPLNCNIVNITVEREVN